MPTVMHIGRYRFFFYSNENQEPAHIHIKAGEDEAKFWLLPVLLASNQWVPHTRTQRNRTLGL